MGNKKERVTSQQKIAWLREQKIIAYSTKKKGYIAPQSERKKRLSEHSINRLYGFYKTKKHPKSTPFYEVYGEKKKLERHLERYPERKISTPSGGISPKIYVTKIHHKTKKNVDEQIRVKYPGVDIEYGRWYETPQHVRDEFFYIIRPSITSTKINENKNRIDTVIDHIIEILDIMVTQRQTLYKDHDVGALVYYRAGKLQIENIEGYTRAPWTNIFDLDLFRDSLHDAFNAALNILSRPSATAKTYVRFTKLLVYVSTSTKATQFNLMRPHHRPPKKRSKK